MLRFDKQLFGLREVHSLEHKLSLSRCRFKVGEDAKFKLFIQVFNRPTSTKKISKVPYKLKLGSKVDRFSASLHQKFPLSEEYADWDEIDYNDPYYD
jgi:hypothetical protein